MDGDSYYLSGSVNRDESDVCAKIRLPATLRLSDYELCLLSCTFIPNWEALSDLYMTITDEKGDDLTVFQDIYESDDVLRIIATRLREKYGHGKTSAVRLLLRKDGPQLYLGKQRELVLSPAMAKLLGIPSLLLENKTDKPKAYTVRLDKPRRTLEDNVYLISCDQLSQNFISSELNGINVLDVVQVHDTFYDQLVEHYSSSRLYMSVNDNTTATVLRVRLLNSKGERIQWYNSKFYVLLHLRRKMWEG